MPYNNPMNPYYQQFYQQPISQAPQTNGSFLVVSSDEDIRRYPVAPGNTITFRIENQPIIVEKSLGTSQFDTPRYERYRMTKEDMPEQQPAPDFALRTDLDVVISDLKEVRQELSSIEGRLSEKKPARTKKEEDHE